MTSEAGLPYPTANAVTTASGAQPTDLALRVNSDPKAKSLAELLHDLSQELAALVHQEVELARAEIAAKGKRLAAGGGLLAGAVVTALLGLGAVVACIIAALSLALPLWLAALLVGVVLLALAGGLGVLGKSEVQRASPPVPQEAVESTKEDVAWLRTKMKSAKP